MTLQYYTLNNGRKIPAIGMGCWKLENAADMVYAAIKEGYRLFDCACDYGNEKEVGEGINRAIKDGLVKRKDLFITSKLWNNFHAKENVKKALMKSLSDFNLDYFDLYLMHFPISFKFVPFEEKYPPGFYCGDGDKFIYEDVPIIETWRAMENLVDEGLVKSIGVSNVSGGLLEDLIKAARIKPASLQIEHHPYLQQNKLVEYAQLKGIVVTGYSNFGPLSFLELGNETAKKTQPLYENKTITTIAAKHGKTPFQVLLRWVNQRGIAIIPKSTFPNTLAVNLHVDEFDLTKEDFEEIAKLDRHLRFNDPWTWDKIPTFV
ncbi:hypothetical protein PACTADRAFT_71309 [Pachysolen tannophilus NRRL Y-2460]|uniref:NAD(P)H-dependent D-xylose reductase n=2 Tax=Pachysolen tannophilus TaxID=4918 RepID=XYL1_PACTA|nr:RecName: Full=NAD(P)H-dependent D-xylose reductase; Short=XR [Pachysolen tannophilus]AAC49526.1 aldose reductase [Pachysolen tannophilus]ODV94521.1 hypothetical protein PACTADRAFT_71309 [Pachysolen tannophilus NRRL Y-2460]